MIIQSRPQTCSSLPGPNYGEDCNFFGLLLIGLGVIGYTGDGSNGPTENDATASTEPAETDSGKKKSVTALIPAIFGVLLVLCGGLALQESLLKHAMHAAVGIGLLGFLAGAGRGAMGIGKFLDGDPSLNQRSFLFVWLMALICLVFVVLCVRSFIAARKQSQPDTAAA